MTTAKPLIHAERRHATHRRVLRHHGVMPNRHDAVDHASRAARGSAPATWPGVTGPGSGTPGSGVTPAGDPRTRLASRFPVPGRPPIGRQR